MTLSHADAEFVREMIRERSAIVIDANKTYLIESRLGPVARTAGVETLTELVALLRKEREGPIPDMVVDAMTTNETTFFRDVTLWEALERSLLPELIRLRKDTRTLTFWSAASSSGQEAYSLAMLLLERFPEIVRTWNVRIIATDLSAEMLGRAAAGRYTQLEVNRGLPAPLLVRYFRRSGAYWQLNEQVRQMVEFRALNLVRPWPFVPPIDVIFLRNVLIYFELETKREILARCRSVMRPDGHLVLGTAETTLNIDDRYRRVVTDQATTYQVV